MTEKITIGTRSPLTPEESASFHAAVQRVEDMCMRYQNDPALAFLVAGGWQVEHTGGGCTMWSKERPDGSTIAVLTSADGMDADLVQAVADVQKGDVILFGAYRVDEDGDWSNGLLKDETFTTLKALQTFLTSEGWL